MENKDEDKPQKENLPPIPPTVFNIKGNATFGNGVNFGQSNDSSTKKSTKIKSSATDKNKEKPKNKFAKICAAIVAICAAIAGIIKIILLVANNSGDPDVDQGKVPVHDTPVVQKPPVKPDSSNKPPDKEPVGQNPGPTPGTKQPKKDSALVKHPPLTKEEKLKQEADKVVEKTMY